jgi:DNA primase
MIDTFGLGYAEPSGQALARGLGERFSPELLEASGLVRKHAESGRIYDAFRGRLMFPIHNESGKVIAFGGRAMREEDTPKYLNSPETPIYRKTSVLYNLHRARGGMRQANRAVLVEGYMDVIGVYAAGIKEVVASCGTALTPAQVRAIRRHADVIAVNFDPDAAGANAAERAIQLLLDEGLHVRIVTLTGGPGADPGTKFDPDEYVKHFGAEAYRAKVDSAGGYFHWLADRARAKFDMREAEGRVAAFKFLLPAVQGIGDKLERAAVVNDMASYLGVEPGLVLEQFKKASTERPGGLGRAGAGAPVAQAAPKVSIPHTERILLNALITVPQARAEILPQLTPALTAGFVTREVFEALRNAGSASEPDGTGEGGSAWSFSGIDARLASGAQTLLHQALTADETEEEALWDQARACLRRLLSDARKRHRDQLRAQVKSAEREGRVEEALNLMAELGRLEQEERAAGGAGPQAANSRAGAA